MPPYGLYSLTDRVNLPEELGARGYGQDVLYDYDPAFGGLKTIERYQPTPFTGARPFQAMYDIAPYISGGMDLGFNADLYNPSFGGVSGYRNTGGIMGIEPVQNMPSVPVQDFQFLSSAYEDDDEEQVEYLPGQEPQGIAKLFKTIGDIYSKLPTPMNILRGGLESLQGFNQRIRNTDFGRSKTLAEYFQKRRERKQAERAREANQAVYESARRQGFTNDRGGFSTDRADDAGTSLGSGQFSPSTSRGRSGY